MRSVTTWMGRTSLTKRRRTSSRSPRPSTTWDAVFQGCDGYELAADLDFDTNGNGRADAGDDYWNDGSGWMPIGTQVFFSIDTYNATFEGNNHVIANLFISKGSYLALIHRRRACERLRLGAPL